MGKFNYILMFALMVSGLSFIHSCFKQDDNNVQMLYPSALVTVKPNADNTAFCLQLNDKTVLNPVNLKESPFGTKEVRALVNYREANEDEIPAGENEENVLPVYVNWLDSIRTKPMVPHLGEVEDVEAYGDDPVEIIDDWLTIVEDGYLTLRFRTNWGNGATHYVNLVYGADPDDPCRVIFHHDAKGDLDGPLADALVAFKLSELPESCGQEITLEWQSYSGRKTAKFNLGPRGTDEEKRVDFTAEELVKSIY